MTLKGSATFLSLTRLNSVLDILPMKRPATADEIAGSILFLLSEDSSYTTGAILNVSGGR